MATEMQRHTVTSHPPLGPMPLLFIPQNEDLSLVHKCRPEVLIHDETANVQVAAVTEMHVTQVLMIIKGSNLKYLLTKVTGCSHTLHGRHCTVLCSGATGTVSEVFECILHYSATTKLFHLHSPVTLGWKLLLFKREMGRKTREERYHPWVTSFIWSVLKHRQLKWTRLKWTEV